LWPGSGFVVASTAPSSAEAERDWKQYWKNTKDIRMLEAFKEMHKDDPFYVRLAEARIEQLKREEYKAALIQDEEIAARRAANHLRPRCNGIEIAVEQNEHRCFNPGAGKTEWFKDCPTCPEMVVVPAGIFTMGSPANEPERSRGEVQIRVSIVAPFAVGRFAVTFDEWDACVADGGCNQYKPNEGFVSFGLRKEGWERGRPQGWGRGRQPVINVVDAKTYVSWLSRKTGRTYRLLSEAQREYATRAGTTTPFWWGSSITTKDANYDGNNTYNGGAKGQYRLRTVPVESFEPNDWGLYQVHGNVWEWTEDCWNESNNGDLGDGSKRTTGDCKFRVVRGGSWLSGPQLLRSACRERNPSQSRSDNQGFRVASSLNP
jgi:formylglycine-generating enzyme required for sulfatase activity